MAAAGSRIAWFGALLLGLGGCQHIGPRAIIEDRMAYNDAVLESWKQQTLLNLVRLRYVDAPEFVDVSSIVNGYSLDRTTAGSLAFDDFPNIGTSNKLSLGLSRSRSVGDHPTITYSPQTRSDFVRSLANPIPPALILALLESGNPADVVLDLGVDSINGISNRQFFGGRILPADPEFRQIVATIKKAQASGAVSLRLLVDKEKKGDGDLVMAIRNASIDPALATELNDLRKLLKLKPDAQEFRVVFGTLPKDQTEIAFRTRSILRIMITLATNVEVPAAHLAEGRTLDIADPSGGADSAITIHSGCKKPDCCFAAVQYKGHYFWIDDRDQISKRTMIYLKVLLALADTTAKEAPPVLTIRAN
jgi:hypothetical protein